MFVIECGKIGLDHDFIYECFYEYFKGEHSNKAIELTRKAMEKLYEYGIEKKVIEKLIRIFGTIEKAYEEYYRNNLKVLEVLYGELDKIIEEIEEELNK